MPATHLKLLLIPAALAVWWRIKARPDAWLPWAGAQLAAALLVESTATALSLAELSNEGLYNLYIPIEFGTLSLMLLHVTRPDRRRKWLTLVAALLFLLVMAWEFARNWRMGEPNLFLAMTVISGGLLLSFLALFAGLALADTVTEPQVERSVWWLLASVALYFMSFTPIFGLVKHFSATDPGKAQAIMKVNDLLFVIRYSFMGIAFLNLLPRPRRS
ncbi:MAG: hypothetical protein IPJ87_01865 [Flavobacteriales bacterium]|jgi:hypothetical protein|nr:hypothetical protein [Flavobacteriales bacterium]MBK7940619.1 hypothetical protein [Flavobacteriales bacterium]MBK9700959.1 hypothetical protein [Flavobacteriales bacterium]